MSVKHGLQTVEQGQNSVYRLQTLGEIQAKLIVLMQ